MARSFRGKLPAAPAQVARLRALDSAAGLDPDGFEAECGRLFGEKPTTLNRYEADLFRLWLLARIDRLAREEAA